MSLKAADSRAGEAIQILPCGWLPAACRIYERRAFKHSPLLILSFPCLQQALHDI